MPAGGAQAAHVRSEFFLIYINARCKMNILSLKLPVDVVGACVVVIVVCKNVVIGVSVVVISIDAVVDDSVLIVVDSS